ncbi:MarR family winged helix-turn-helix transcriptional regulator [Aureimonas glaciei]|uniref:MarR family transcriptional regulator n=1 Tax=Aureimonas glaciei TaxID=1776957 RepID=A0A916XWU7_9HYPH|nr:MarR family winged helix-turn-helix transcriptional regulator [Aureimonas glaciei]GGD18009.1 MarR family transcriptional regulator [Aureimonas glaciei]
MTRDDDLRFNLTTAIHRVGRHWRRLVRDIAVQHGISEACAHPLATIGRLGDGLRQGALAEEVGMEGPSLVRLLDQLCSCGLVERRDDPVDRRAKTLWLTDKGRAAVERIGQDLIGLRAEVLNGISREDLEATLRVFSAFETFDGRAATPVAGKREPGA